MIPYDNLSAEDLERIRRFIEEADGIDAVDDKLRCVTLGASHVSESSISAQEMEPDVVQRVDAVLTKSRTSLAGLAPTIQRLIDKNKRNAMSSLKILQVEGEPDIRLLVGDMGGWW